MLRKTFVTRPPRRVATIDRLLIIVYASVCRIYMASWLLSWRLASHMAHVDAVAERMNDPGRDQTPYRRNQEAQAGGIGQDARRDQQGTGHQDAHRLNHGFAG